MAINSYSTLQTAVSNWLDRDDLTDPTTRVYISGRIYIQ
jgi:hypothetical protein